MNLDITFCSKLNCNNKKCKRNQIELIGALDVPKEILNISISDFKDCEFWKE